MAAYPSSIVVFTPHQNLTEVIDAAHPNRLQDEVTAIENILGTSPQVSTAPSSAASFNGSGTTFLNLTGRLANIETGIVADSHTQYVHLHGGDTITPPTSKVGLTIQPTATPTVHVFDIKDSSGAVRVGVDQNYNLSTNNSLVLTQASAAASVQALPFGGAGVVGTLASYAREDHVHAVAKVPAALVTIPFHVAGSFTAGFKAPKFIVPVGMTLSAARFVLDSGAGATFRLAYNVGTSFSATSVIAGTSVQTLALTDVLQAGTTISIEIMTTGGLDLSITIQATVT